MKKIIMNLINDTLKRDKNGTRRFSRTSLTMFSAWLIAISFAIFDFISNGLRYDVWIALLGVATVVKVADSAAKKLNNLQ